MSNKVAAKLLAVEAAAKRQLRCYGNLLVSGQEAVVALFDPAPLASPDVITIEGRMSTFGGPDDRHMTFTENLAWIEDEGDAAAYPGFFLPRRGGEGFARRLRPEASLSGVPLGVQHHTEALPRTADDALHDHESCERPLSRSAADRLRAHAEGHARRNVDVSPGVARALGLNTDDVCRVVIPTPLSATRDVAPPPSQARGLSQANAALFPHGRLRSPSAVRQRQAQAAGCSLTIDFHFNSNGSTAHGGEVYSAAGTALPASCRALHLRRVSRGRPARPRQPR
jgi:hypothetical protein